MSKPTLNTWSYAIIVTALQARRELRDRNLEPAQIRENLTLLRFGHPCGGFSPFDSAASSSVAVPSHSPQPRMKSTSANLGAMGLSELAKRVEHGARAGTLNAAEAPILVAEIKRGFQRVTHELNALLTRSAL